MLPAALSQILINRNSFSISYRDCAELSLAKRKAWQKVLSSIATSEGMEHLVIEPLIVYFASQPLTQKYLLRHAEDEKVHHKLLSQYLEDTFLFKKKNNTLSDVLFYRVLLRYLKRRIRSMPLLGLAILNTYELFAVQLYKNLKHRAMIDGLNNLAKLIEEIEKDEREHLVGMNLLIKDILKGEKQLNPTQLRIIKIWLLIISFDVHMGKFSFHNRKLRKAFATIGITDQTNVKAIKSALRNTIRMVT